MEKNESVFILNDIEKRIADEFVQHFIEGRIPSIGKHPGSGGIYHMSHEFYPCKDYKVVRGMMLGCPYRMKYRDSQHIFFSAWDTNDVCGIFYDMVETVSALNKINKCVIGHYRPFNVDLHTESYVFFSGDVALSIARHARYIYHDKRKPFYSSQYIFSVFCEAEPGVYGPLIERLKTENYSNVYILQIWIRGEILYFGIVDDGGVLRPENQRGFTEKEENDINRKSLKIIRNNFYRIDLDALPPPIIKPVKKKR
jgi:hypothetical protein